LRRNNWEKEESKVATRKAKDEKDKKGRKKDWFIVSVCKLKKKLAKILILFNISTWNDYEFNCMISDLSD